MTTTIFALTSEAPIHILALGPSGSGKTGSIASLLPLGYRVALLSLDGNITNLQYIVRTQMSAYIDNLSLVGISQGYRVAGKRLVPTTDDSGWQQLNLAIKDAWPDKKLGFEGCPFDWDTKTVLVVDQLTDITHLAELYVREANSLLSKPMEYKYWQIVHDQILSLVKVLSSLPCHCILISHVAFKEESAISSLMKGFPSTLGENLGRKLPGMFSTLVSYHVEGTGKKAQRVIDVAPTPTIDTKLGLPQDVLNGQETLPVETGLGKIFELLIAAEEASNQR